MTSPFEDLDSAIEAVRNAQRELPLIVAPAWVLEVVRQDYPWYPEDRLQVRPDGENQIYVIDSSLFDPRSFQ